MPPLKVIRLNADSREVPQALLGCTPFTADPRPSPLLLYPSPRSPYHHALRPTASLSSALRFICAFSCGPLLPPGHCLAPWSWRTVSPRCFLLQTSSKGGFSSLLCLESSTDFLNLLQLQPNSLMSLNSDFWIQFTYFKSILMGLPSKWMQGHWSRFSEMSCAPSSLFPPSLLSCLPLPLFPYVLWAHFSHWKLGCVFASLKKNNTETVKPVR